MKLEAKDGHGVYTRIQKIVEANMGQFLAVFFALIVAITVLILGGVFSESIAAWLRRRFNWSYEGERVLVWSMVILSAFSFGLVVMYLLLR